MLFRIKKYLVIKRLFRKKQSELESTYKIEMDNIQAEKLREQRKLLDEFSRTKELLQYEIRELKLK